jgi:hypothetical protein
MSSSLSRIPDISHKDRDSAGEGSILGIHLFCFGRLFDALHYGGVGFVWPTLASFLLLLFPSQRPGDQSQSTVSSSPMLHGPLLYFCQSEELSIYGDYQDLLARGGN